MILLDLGLLLIAAAFLILRWNSEIAENLGVPELIAEEEYDELEEPETPEEKEPELPEPLKPSLRATELSL